MAVAPINKHLGNFSCGAPHRIGSWMSAGQLYLEEMRTVSKKLSCWCDISAVLADLIAAANCTGRSRRRGSALSVQKIVTPSQGNNVAPFLLAQLQCGNHIVPFRSQVMARFLMAAPILFLSSVSFAEGNYLLQRPALSHTQIVFSFAGDLWSVAREGGDAKRLTTGPGIETDPIF